MPLYDGAIELLRVQLDALRRGERVSLVVLGSLTDDQHRALCEFRLSRGLPGSASPEIVYLGRHHYDSRAAQGYTVEDMVLQVEAALAADAEPLFTGKMTSIRSRIDRADGYGCMVRDQAIFEMTARKPRVELYSVIPKGDGRSAKTTKPR